MVPDPHTPETAALRQREDEARQASQERYRLMVEQSGLGVGYYSLDGSVLHLNRQALRELGGKADDYVGKSIIEVFGSPEGSEYLRRLRSVASSPYSCEFEDQVTLPTGRKWFLSSYARVANDAGDILGVQIVSRDITQRKRAEGIVNVRDELKRVLDLVPDMICTASPDGRFLSVNPAFEKVLGYSQEELLGIPYLDLIHPDDRDATRAEVQRQLDGHPTAHFVNRYRCKDGTHKVLEWCATPADQGILYAAARDITERRLAEDKLRESEERFRSLIESAPEAIFVQSSGCFVYLNPAALTLFGAARPEELLGHHFTEYAAPECREIIRERIRLQRETGLPAPPMEQRFVRCDGSSVWVETTAVRIRFQGRDAHVVYLRDITERKRVEKVLREQRQALRHMERVQMMAELAAAVTHEVSQPLTAILSNAEAAQMHLEKTAPDMDELRAVLADIVADDKRACQVVLRIRALLRKETPHPTPFDIGEAVREMLAITRGDHDFRDVTMQLELAEDLPQALGDKTQVQQVIFNLLLNARQAIVGVRIAKDREQNPGAGGKAEILVSTGRDASGQVTVSVRDSGPGISAEAIARLFEPFFTTRPDGLGMGLPICCSIVKAHGGRIWAENHPDGGAVLTFTLPAESGSGEGRGEKMGP